MKRIIDFYLAEWRLRASRKPLLLRGARQVGKTHAVRELGKGFANFIEINLETNLAARSILEKDLDIRRIVLQLSELVGKKIIPGSTLLFFDEIQGVPKAITALRYFYESMPELHVIAAGSLLEFAIEQVGMPVGRISSLYMYPLSFLEFLIAVGHGEWARAIMNHDLDNPMSDPLHEKLLSFVGIYLAIGGMPEAVSAWIEHNISREVKIVHADLMYTYQQDFGKYARSHQIKYLTLLFQKAIDQLSNKFMYARVGEYQKRELEPALQLLVQAGLLYKVTHSAGQGIPLGAQADLDYFKLIFLDVGLGQALLKFDLTPWFLDPLATFVNKGEIVEAFVGQELLAYSDPIAKDDLFYWTRDSRGSEAEIDYLVQLGEQVVPVEVKAGTSRRIKSMQSFLETHGKSSYGIRYSALPYEATSLVHSYPLYAVATPFFKISATLKKALLGLLE